MNRANEARDMTKKLGALAEKTKCAIILIGHMNKASGNKAAYRGMGSIDFFAVARSVLLVGRVEGEPNTRAVVQIKNNLAAFGHPKAFALSEEGFQWLGDYEITVDEVLGGIAPKANKMELAKQMLRELAETHSAVLSNEIFDRADELGISKRTLENAHSSFQSTNPFCKTATTQCLYLLQPCNLQDRISVYSALLRSSLIPALPYPVPSTMRC